MDNRVFTIDRDCYIIFAEELSNRKERFLRIGNSESIKEFDGQLTFINLITPMLPGAIETELDIFRKEVDRKATGLKRFVKDFVRVLIDNGKDVTSLNVIFADEQSEVKGKTEREFIKDISTSSIKKRHTFASFYSMGNIKIFDKDGVFFDLKDNITKSYSLLDEINDITNFYKKFYDYSDCSGFIISNSSLFVFSDRSFICITEGGNWVLDAAVIGINPLMIDCVCITGGVVPQTGWYEVFYQGWAAGKRTKVVSSDTRFFNDQIVFHIDPSKRTFDHTVGKIRVLYQNNRLRVLIGGLKLSLYDTNKNFVTGAAVEYSYINFKGKVDGEFSIDRLSENKITVYKAAPVVISDEKCGDDFVINNAKSVTDSIPVHIEEILKNDSDYTDDYIIPLENRNSPILFVVGESIRRIVAEGVGVRTDIFMSYDELLAGISGDYFRKNGIVIKQMLFKGKKTQVRDVAAFYGELKNRFSINPYDLLSESGNEAAFKSILSLASRFSDPVDGDKSLLRVNKSIEQLDFYRSERDRLKEFIDELDVKDRLMEEKGFPDDAPYSILRPDEDHEKQDESYSNEKLGSQHTGDMYNAEELFTGNHNHKPVKWWRLLILLLVVVSIVLILIFTPFCSFVSGKIKNISDKAKTILVIPHLKDTTADPVIVKKDTANTLKKSHAFVNKGTKNDKKNIKNKNGKIDKFVVDKNVEKLKSIKEKGESNLKLKMRKSIYFSFFMTPKDTLDITNKIAIKNGYRRILFQFEIKYSGGNNPDWIYPGNVLVMPDDSRVIVKSGDTLWRICENYLLQQMNADEVVIKGIIDKTNSNEIDIEEAKSVFTGIIRRSDSEMIRSFCSIMLLQDEYKNWVYFEQNMKE